MGTITLLLLFGIKGLLPGQVETSAKASFLGLYHLERSVAKSKDQFCASEKRQTELILRQAQDDGQLRKRVSQRSQIVPSPGPPLLYPEHATAERSALAKAALAQVGVTLFYDPAYSKIGYPNGDVPMDRGVCTDVVIRALRKEDVDLQVLVHEDKKRFPEVYPHDWGSAPDASIDHRRVPNLMTFFHRQKRDVALTLNGADYLPGDIVVWRLPSGLLHIGLVADRIVPGADRPMVVHNIGNGAQCEDALFAFTLIGHYRWFM
jgi:uncharacterized protein YijF (DUF1287 family)